MKQQNLIDEDWFMYGGLLEEIENTEYSEPIANSSEAACGCFLLIAILLIALCLLLSIVVVK